MIDIVQDDATGIIRVTGVVEGQKIEESRGPSAAVGETLAFERADVVHGGSPTTGSLVRFIVAYHLRSKQKRAVEVEVTKVAQPVPGAREWDQGKDSRIQKQDLPQAHESQSKPRQMGVVVTVKESFGFIRPVDQVRNDGPQVFFHFSELPEVGSLHFFD